MTDRPERRAVPGIVLRCARRGDTFPAEEERATCPLCGSADLEPAHEPLL